MEVWDQDGVWNRQVYLWMDVFQLSYVYGWILQREEKKLLLPFLKCQNAKVSYKDDFITAFITDL